MRIWQTFSTNYQRSRDRCACVTDFVLCRQVHYLNRKWPFLVDVFVDDVVMLGVYDDAVVVMANGGHGGADGRQRLVRDPGMLVVVAAGRGHEHGGGWRVPTAALVCQRPVALVRTGTTRTRAIRPLARLIVRVEQVGVDVLFARVHVGRHHVDVMVVMVMCTAAVNQRLRFLKRKTFLLLS